MRLSVLRPLMRSGCRLLSIVFATFMLATSVGAAEPAPVVEPVADIMHQMARDVQTLLPKMYQYDRQTAPADKALITQTMANMRTHLEKVSTLIAPRSDTYQVSVQVLGSQLEQAQREFAKGREDFAMDLLRSATSVCATCHTQDDRTATWLAPAVDEMEDPFIAAEFFFMTRQYDLAFDAYQEWLDEQAALNYDTPTRTAFQRLLLTTLQVERSAKLSNKVLDKFIQSENIDQLLEKELIDWARGIEELDQLVDIARHPETDELKRLATQWLRTGEKDKIGHVYMAESSRPQIVWLRGELYRALVEETDSSAIPNWLYWLAVSDRLLEYRFYYSLADMYLKQCMLDYTDAPVAQTCYREYENYVEFFYSGSSGTHIPDDLKEEMEMLKDLVFDSGEG